MIRVQPLTRRLLATAAARAAGGATQPFGSAASTSIVTASHDRAELVSLLDRLLLRPGAGQEVLSCYAMLRERLTPARAQSSALALHSLGATPEQAASMLRANPLYLLELDAAKLGQTVAEERADPGATLRQLPARPKLRVEHFVVQPDGSLSEVPSGGPAAAQLPAGLRSSAAALSKAFACPSNRSSTAGTGPALLVPPPPQQQQQQQFQSFVNTWLAMG